MRQAERPIRLVQHPALMLWCCYCALIPFYAFRAGVPQPSNAVIVLLVPVVFMGWNGRLGRDGLSIYRALLWFTVWVLAVDVAWGLILLNLGKNLLFPFYYLFNALLVLVTLILYRQYGTYFLRLTTQLVFWITVAQVALSFFYRGHWGGSRNELFFDNPNQLGYYSLLAACVMVLGYRYLDFSALRISIGLMCCGWLAIISASRSAVSGIALLVVLLAISSPRVLVLACLVAGAVLLISPAESSLDPLEARVAENRHPNLSFFEQRGYDRIWNNPEHLVLGASEGNNRRFASTTKIGMVEIHSTVGTILFCYGIIGFTLFAIFVIRLARGMPLKTTLILAPPLLYTIAHQGLRFSLLWVLVGMFIAIREMPVLMRRVVA